MPVAYRTKISREEKHSNVSPTFTRFTFYDIFQFMSRTEKLKLRTSDSLTILKFKKSGF